MSRSLYYDNVNKLNNRFNTIRSINKGEDWSNTTYEIITNILSESRLSDDDILSYNELYGKIYNCYLLNNIDINTLIDRFNKEMINTKNKLDSLNYSFPDQLKVLDQVIEKISSYVAIYNYKKVTLNDNTIKYYMYKTLTDIMFTGENGEKSVKNLIDQLIVHPEKVTSVFPIIGKFLTYGKDNLENINLEDSPLDNNKERSTFENFIFKIFTNLNDHLSKNYKDNLITIEEICKVIFNVGSFMNSSFVKESDKILYKKCFPMWTDELINSLSNSNIEKIISNLQVVEEYIGSDEYALKISDKFIDYIELVLNKYKPLEQHMSDNKLFNDIIVVLNNTNTLSSKWSKYKSFKSINKKLNKFIDQKIIEYFNIGLKQIIDHECNKNDPDMGEVAALFNYKYINGFLHLLQLKEADYCLLSYLDKLQSRYCLYMSDNKYNVTKQMYFVDKLILENIKKYLESNKELDAHVATTVTKITNVISDIDISFQINNEMRNISISYVDKDGNTVNKPSYNSKNILYTVTSGSNNWTQTVKQISENYGLNHFNDMKYVINTLNEYYSNKCPQRKLRLFNDMSTVVLNFKTDLNILYKFKVTLAQSSVLMSFSKDAKVQSFKTICEKVLNNNVERTSQQLKRVCKSLVESKVIKQVASDTYEIDTQIKLPKQYNNGETIVNIAKFYYKMKDTVEEVVIPKTITKEIEYDRNNTLKCYIIRECKKEKTTIFTVEEIYGLLKSSLKLFDYDMKQVNSTIEQLTKTYYLDKVKNGYRYAEE